jgi:hypothetical protein
MLKWRVVMEKMTFNKLTKWLKVGMSLSNKKGEYIPFDSVGFYPIGHFEVRGVRL